MYIYIYICVYAYMRTQTNHTIILYTQHPCFCSFTPIELEVCTRRGVTHHPPYDHTDRDHVAAASWANNCFFRCLAMSFFFFFFFCVALSAPEPSLPPDPTGSDLRVLVPRAGPS